MYPIRIDQSHMLIAILSLSVERFFPILSIYVLANLPKIRLERNQQKKKGAVLVPSFSRLGVVAGISAVQYSPREKTLGGAKRGLILQSIPRKEQQHQKSICEKI